VLGFLVISTTFQTVFGVASTFPIEKQYFDRDREAQVYSVLAFYLSKVLADLPFEFLLPTLQGTILYWMANLNPAVDRFFIFLAIIFLINNVVQALGLLVRFVIVLALVRCCALLDCSLLILFPLLLSAPFSSLLSSVLVVCIVLSLARVLLHTLVLSSPPSLPTTLCAVVFALLFLRRCVFDSTL
jgi:ABC-2 type transporter